MAIITKCTNDSCKIKSKCYRYTFKPNPPQAYKFFDCSENGYEDYIPDNKKREDEITIREHELRMYLAGACKNLEDGGTGWRREITKMLEQVAEWQDKKVKIIDPTKYFSYKEKKHKTQKQVKEFYLNKIKNCDIVVCNLDFTDCSPGTAQEAQFARMVGVPIIGFGTKNVYPWISEVDCEVTFDSMHEAVDYIRDYYF